LGGNSEAALSQDGKFLTQNREIIFGRLSFNAKKNGDQALFCEPAGRPNELSLLSLRQAT
jgi:hypothetical protein